MNLLCPRRNLDQSGEEDSGVLGLCSLAAHGTEVPPSLRSLHLVLRPDGSVQPGECPQPL